MTATAAHGIKRALLSVGHYARRLRADRFPGVAVLCYHGVRADEWPVGTMRFEGLHVTARELAAHCRVLRELCHPISLADWHAARRGGPPLPPRPVLVTFDDGYRTVATFGRPILERYQISAVTFVCTDPVEQRQLFWHDSVAGSGGVSEVQRLKTLPYDEWDALQAPAAYPVDDDDPHAPLSVDDVRSLAQHPLFEIGSHTAGHAILSRANREQQREQMRRSKAALEAWTARAVTAFAYPNGQPGTDYTAETVELVHEEGFDCAFTTRHGFASADEPMLERSRFFMLAGVTAAELAHRLTYSWRVG
jgi:peptidoglycan/xylan/chitin deacetylase (PgdA/CDA1 family)